MKIVKTKTKPNLNRPPARKAINPPNKLEKLDYLGIAIKKIKKEKNPLKSNKIPAKKAKTLKKIKNQQEI